MPVLKRLTIIGLGVLLAVVALPSPPAGADSLAAVAGGGTISPGLTTTPTKQTSISFNATAVGAIRELPATCNVAFTNGRSNIDETIALGDGFGYASCYGTAVTGEAVGYCCFRIDYLRVGAVVVATGWESYDGTTIEGVFLFEPTTFNPTTSFFLQGVVEVGVGV